MVKYILVKDLGQITTICLNRPDKRNALHQEMILELSQTLSHLANNSCRVVIIQGAGEHFCAGGDIAWMQKIAESSHTENYTDAQLLADLIYQLYSFPKPTIVLAHGGVFGGGMGLLAAADIAIAAANTNFGFPEVKIGLIPSIVSPYIVNTIGERLAHYYFLTGDYFDVETAYRIGLIHRITDNESLIPEGMELALLLLNNAPRALKAVKELIRHVNKEKMSEALVQKTAENLAEIRASSEGQEGLKAFLQKRKPSWS